MAKLNTKTSVVDYLKSKGQNSSFSNRAKLASQLGIKDYRGTASQNTALLNGLQSQKSTSPKTPQNVATKPVVTMPKLPNPTKPQNIATKPVVTMPTPTKPSVSPPMALPPVPRPAPFPNQPNGNVKLPESTPNPFEEKVKLLESELSNLRDTLSSRFESEQNWMKPPIQPQPMFDIGQLASLLKPQQPQFNMSEITGQFNDMFSKLQSEYNSRLEAMQRMLEQQNSELQKRYDELLNKFKYNQSQLTPANYNSVGDGVSLFGNDFTPNGIPTNTSETPVGYRQFAQMNDALLRYMQKLWGGGF